MLDKKLKYAVRIGTKYICDCDCKCGKTKILLHFDKLLEVCPHIIPQIIDPKTGNKESLLLV
jgi:hypothetical protein